MAITALGLRGLRFSITATRPKRGRGAAPAATVEEAAQLAPAWGRVEARHASAVPRDGREWLDGQVLAWRRTL